MDKHTKHNRRATLYQERMQVQRAALANLKDGNIDAAVRHQAHTLELTVEIQKLSLEIFLENTTSPNREHDGPYAIAAPVR